MKISNNITIYACTNLHGAENAEKSGEQGTEQNGKSVYVGTLNNDLLQNDIMLRKKEAQEKAMKVVGDAFAGDRAIDEDLEERRRSIDRLESDNKELLQELKDISEQREQLIKEYGITDEVTDVVVMGSAEMEEFQKRWEELEDRENACRLSLDDNNQTILEENAIIRGTRMERLKHSPMLKAQKQAEEILEAAGEEIIGMVVEDAKEHVDEETAEREEQAEKLEAEREEQEAFIEKQQEKRKEQEELLEEMPVEEMLSLERTKADVQKEVQQIVDKMKLVAEDIKGAVVDQTL